MKLKHKCDDDKLIGEILATVNIVATADVEVDHEPDGFPKPFVELDEADSANTDILEEDFSCFVCNACCETWENEQELLVAVTSGEIVAEPGEDEE